MALDKELWQEAKARFECGESLNSISIKLGIAKSNLSRRSKREKWNAEKAKPYIEAKYNLEKSKSESKAKLNAFNKQKRTLKAQSELMEFEMMDNLANAEIMRRALVENVTISALKQAHRVIKKGTIRKNIKVSNGVAVGESIEQIDDELTAKDLKDFVELADKASLTLKVNDRFAPQLQQNFNASEIEIIAPFKELEK